MSLLHNGESNARQLELQTYRRLPKTGPFKAPGKVHIWGGPEGFCRCGKLHSDDQRLEKLEPGERLDYRLCGRCDWHHTLSDLHLARGAEVLSAVRAGDYDQIREWTKEREQKRRW